MAGRPFSDRLARSEALQTPHCRAKGSFRMADNELVYLHCEKATDGENEPAEPEFINESQRELRMPRAAAKKEVVKKPTKEDRAVSGLLALAATGDIIKTVERESAKLKVTYRNGLVETFFFKHPQHAVLVVMTLMDLNTCIDQAKVIRVEKERQAPRPE